ncbi:MAG: ribosome small subunit-dependent GTPase A [Ginsengibacter sp.]
MNGFVYKSTGTWYQVRDENGDMINARIKGKFKIDNITSTNPLAVGDKVDFDKEENEDGFMIINNIYPRKNYITRQSPHNKHQHHIIASNLDQSLLFATLKDPKTSRGFIDRFLVASEAYHVPAILVFNKVDVYRKRELERLEEFTLEYMRAGYKVLPMSIMENKGVDEVINLLKNKTTLLSGHSGVGKSSFVNHIFPGITLKTQDVSGWSGKGLHTTTFAEMYDLPGGGRIIDTPGLREFALMDIEREELSHYFHEMKELINECRFNNCMHIEEPDCAVKHAVNEGKISEERYISYRTILDSIDGKKW